MANYTVTTNFGAKDSLPSGNAGKLIKGTEFTTEFNNISTAIATKADTLTTATKASPTLTGTVAITTAATAGAVALQLNNNYAPAGKITTGYASPQGFFSIGQGATGLRFIDYTQKNISPFNVDTNADSDNLVDLGKLSARFDDIYATNGTIQTSDQNEKQDIEELTEAETRVAVACKGLLRKFRWKSSAEENDDEARTHFGIIAQDLQAAFAAEGLDAGDYAMFISSSWEDELGREQTRLGVRYSELLAFIIGGI